MKLRLILLTLLLAGCAQQPGLEEECQQLRTQQRDNLRRIDELQKLAAERLRQQREEQRRADDLQQKLNALRAIERDLHRPGQRR